ncbi:hypothetical protein BHM03_00010831, partial [Ensete ventricosum]
MEEEKKAHYRDGSGDDAVLIVVVVNGGVATARHHRLLTSLMDFVSHSSDERGGRGSVPLRLLMAPIYFSILGD